MNKSSRWIFGAVLSFALAASQTGFAAPIGEAAETLNDVTGELGSVARPLATGSGVSADETVSTGSSSSALLRFLDNSSLNIGEVSTVVLDRFVYDPNRGTDDAVFNLTKGAMRFVSGGRRGSNAMITTPVGIIGIRGTDIVLACEPDRCANAVEEGRIRICPIPAGTPVGSQLIQACRDGNSAILPCGFVEIAAEDEQEDGEGNFTIVQNNCVFSPPTNLDSSIFDWLAEQIASGSPMPGVDQITTIAATGPAISPAIQAAGLGALIAVPIIIIASDDDDDPDPVSP